MLFRLSPLTIFVATAIVAVGELASGTRLEFVLAVMVIMVCAGVTFNILEGFTSLAGILYAEFALRTIVVSQFVKVALFERADSNLEVPYLTIMLYAIFYACVTLSVFIFSRFRFPVPKPLEPVNDSHARKLYIIALVAGTIATVFWDANNLNPTQVHNATRTVSMQLSGLLMFAVVLAVRQKIRDSHGQHSLGWTAVVPILLLQASSLIVTSRSGFLAPVLVYFVCAFTQGYRFKKRHFAGAAALGMIFFFVVSPWQLYNRAQVTDQYFSDRVQTTMRTLVETRGRTSLTSARDLSEIGDAYRFNYYSRTDNNVITRFALVRPDSDLISACSGGYHYGWATIKNDFLYALPHAFFPRKPIHDSSSITGHAAGLNGEWQATAETAFSAIADSYAGFGFLGVVLLGLFVFPVFLMVCRSAFDIKKPWGVVAIGMTVTTFGEWLVGAYILSTIELPLLLFALSWFVGTIALLVPTRPDNFGRIRREVRSADDNSAIAPVS